MKRGSAILLCICLIFTACNIDTMTTAYADDEIITTEQQEALEFLDLLQIMSVEADSWGNTVSRADFAIYVANIMGINSSLPNDRRYYIDVPTNHWAANSISTLTELGVLSVGEDARFNPDDPIIAAEAVKILLSIMGYGEYAEANGGYPYGYLCAAQNIDLIRSIDMNKALSCAEVAELIYNAITLPVLEITSFGEDENRYQTSNDETLLSRYHNIYIAEGRVTQSGAAALCLDRGIIEKNEMRLDDTIYTTEEAVNAADYLGMQVELYYRQENPTDIGAVLLIRPQNNQTIIDIDIRDIKEFDIDTYEISYYENEKTGYVRTKNIAYGAYIVKNGTPVTDIDQTMGNLEKGSIRLIDFDSYGGFDAVIIWEYENIVVSLVDRSGMKVYDKYSAEKTLDLNPAAAEIDILRTDGTAAAMEDIQNGSLLTVYRSANCVYIYIADTEISGTVYEINSVQEETEIYFGATYEDAAWYKIDEDFLQNGTHSLKVGASMTIKTDMFGFVAEITDVSSSDRLFGYIISTSDSTSPFRDIFTLRVFNQNGEFVNLDCDKSIKIDDDRAKSKAEIIGLLERGKPGIIGQLIRYRLNSDGKIAEIDTVYSKTGSDEISLHKTLELTNLLYTYSPRLFGQTTIVSASTVFFGVPDDERLAEANEDEFYILPLSYFAGSTYHNIESYKLDIQSGFEDVIVKKGEIKSGTAADMFLVSEVLSAVDSEGNIVEKITGYTESVLYEYEVSDKFSIAEMGVEEGDILQLTCDVQGKVIDAAWVYDRSTNAPPTWAPSNGAHRALVRFVYGNVISTRDNILKLGYNDSTTVDEVGNITCVVVFDSTLKDNKIYVGTVGDLVDAESTGGNGSKVFVRTNYGAMRWMIVYK